MSNLLLLSGVSGVPKCRLFPALPSGGRLVSEKFSVSLGSFVSVGLMRPGLLETS